jgi:hypothetical protein
MHTVASGEVRRAVAVVVRKLQWLMGSTWWLTHGDG